MSLRRITFLSIVIVTIGLAAVLLTNVTRIFSTYFAKQEKKNSFLSIRQVQNVLDEQLTFLDKSGNDWGDWDDLYQYMADRNEAFASSYFAPASYKNMGIDLLAVLNDQGEVVFGGTVKNDQISAQLPADLSAHLKAGDPILAGPEASEAKHGFIQAGGLPMLVVSHPILRTDRSGPSRGTLLIGKTLNQAALNQFDNMLMISIEMFSVDEIQTHGAPQAVLTYSPSPDEPNYVELSDKQVAVYALLKNVYNQPAFILQVSRFPTIYTDGLLVQNYLIIPIVLIALIFGLILFFLLEFYVLNRVRQLSSEVQAVGISGDLHKRVSVRRRDELTGLMVKINEMLSALEAATSQRIESEERFRTLVESMDDLVFTVSSDRREVTVYEQKSPAQSALPSPALLAKPETLQRELENHLAEHQENLDRSLQGETTSFEWDAPDPARNFITTVSPIYSPDKAIVGVVGVSKDITNQKKLELELRARIRELNALLNVSRQLMNRVDKDVVQSLICRLAVEEIGMSAAAIFIPSPDGSALLPAAWFGVEDGRLETIGLCAEGGAVENPVASAYTEGKMKFFATSLLDLKLEMDRPALEPGQHAMAVIPIAYGERTLAVLALMKHSAPCMCDENLPFINAFINLSSVALQNAYLFLWVSNGRERVQNVSRRLVEVQEEERRKIALELHDEIGQALTGLHFSVDMIQTLPAEQVQRQIATALEIINDMIQRVRQMSLDLRPSMLDDLGILPTLIWYFERYTSQTGIQVNFQHSAIAERRFTPDVEITLFRVIQEGLTNVARYANVCTANVRLWAADETLGIQIEDEGAGFDVDETLNLHKSKGLDGIRERLGFLRGQLTILSQPGEGTVLTAEIPWQKLPDRRRHAR